MKGAASGAMLARVLFTIGIIEPIIEYAIG